MNVLFWIVMAAAATLLTYVWRWERGRLLVGERLHVMGRSVAPEVIGVREISPRTLRLFPPRYPFVAPAVGTVVLGLLWLAFSWPADIAVAFGILAGVFAHLVERWIADTRAARIESQLSDAIDLLVSSLRAGAALLAALEVALEEAPPPLRQYLEEIVGRIRLGDDPREVISALAAQVPLETFRLFATAIVVHWDVGGSLASTLATIGSTIRDRVDLARRVKAQGIEAHVSVVVVLLIVYVLAYLMWRADPDRIQEFVLSGVGTTLTAIVVALQSIGLLWMHRISEGEY
jgi:tight adherence protein B